QYVQCVCQLVDLDKCVKMSPNSSLGLIGVYPIGNRKFFVTLTEGSLATSYENSCPVNPSCFHAFLVLPKISCDEMTWKASRQKYAEVCTNKEWFAA
uniref:HECT domain-containing protein n=1 Tax=Steinernema glaseri TaxID=37863 RepID=A0A1I7XYE1_9BILA